MRSGEATPQSRGRGSDDLLGAAVGGGEGGAVGVGVELGQQTHG